MIFLSLASYFILTPVICFQLQVYNPTGFNKIEKLVKQNKNEMKVTVWDTSGKFLRLSWYISNPQIQKFFPFSFSWIKCIKETSSNEIIIHYHYHKAVFDECHKWSLTLFRVSLQWGTFKLCQPWLFSLEKKKEKCHL